MNTRLTFVRSKWSGVVVVLCISLLASKVSLGGVITIVPSGGWTKTAPGGGMWDDQNQNDNSQPFPNIEAALDAASLPKAGLTKITKIDLPATSGGGFSLTFTNGLLEGYWDFDESTNLGGKTLAYFSLKAGPKWNLWTVMADVDGDASNGFLRNNFDTNSSAGGLINNGGNPAGLSHITFWAIDGAGTGTGGSSTTGTGGTGTTTGGTSTTGGGSGPPVIPEPASMLVWSIVGLGTLFSAGRFRRRRVEDDFDS